VTGAGAVTVFVVTVNVFEVVPAATVTLAGTVAAFAFELERVTVASPVGAIPVSVTVPVGEAPPTTSAGLTVTEAAAGGNTVSVAACVTPAFVAEIVTGVEEVTAFVAAVKVPVEAPAAMVTLAGTVAAALALESMTPTPAAGAAPLSVRVPIEGTPPTTLVELRASETRAGCSTVRGAMRATPPKEAEISNITVAATGFVAIEKVTALPPAGTVTLAGTVAAAVLALESVTAAPAAGAGADNVTVPVAGSPPTTSFGSSEIAAAATGTRSEVVRRAPFLTVSMSSRRTPW
jgi:hypothetical protein